jgi:hypothetical protein
MIRDEYKGYLAAVNKQELAPVPPGNRAHEVLCRGKYDGGVFAGEGETEEVHRCREGERAMMAVLDTAAALSAKISSGDAAPASGDAALSRVGSAGGGSSIPDTSPHPPAPLRFYRVDNALLNKVEMVAEIASLHAGASSELGAVGRPQPPSSSLVQPLLHRGLLEEGAVLVLDCGLEVFVWKGRRATLADIKEGTTFGRALAAEANKEVIALRQNLESVSFKARFDDWHGGGSSSGGGSSCTPTADGRRRRTSLGSSPASPATFKPPSAFEAPVFRGVADEVKRMFDTSIGSMHALARGVGDARRGLGLALADDPEMIVHMWRLVTTTRTRLRTTSTAGGPSSGKVGRSANVSGLQAAKQGGKEEEVAEEVAEKVADTQHEYELKMLPWFLHGTFTDGDAYVVHAR